MDFPIMLHVDHRRSSHDSNLFQARIGCSYPDFAREALLTQRLYLELPSMSETTPGLPQSIGIHKQ